MAFVNVNVASFKVTSPVSPLVIFKTTSVVGCAFNTIVNVAVVPSYEVLPDTAPKVIPGPALVIAKLVVSNVCAVPEVVQFVLL